MDTPVDLAGERARAADRAWQRDLELRARLLLNGGSDVRKEGEEWKPQWRGGGLWAAPREILEEVARQRWPDATCVPEIVVVAERLQRESGSAVRHLDPMEVRSLADDRLTQLKAALRDELRRDSTLTNGALREKMEARGSSFGPLTSFEYHVANVRKELGIKGIRGSRPARPSSDPQVKVAPTENGKPIQLPSVQTADEFIAQETPTVPPAPVAATLTDAIAESQVRPTQASDEPQRVVGTLIAIDGKGGSFSAEQRADGTWMVDLKALLPEPLMAELAAVIWEQVVGRPQGARA